MAVGMLLVAVATVLPPAEGVSEEDGTIQPIPGGTLSKIAAGGPVRVCTDPDNLPFSSRDSQQPGFDVEVARAVAKEIGAAAQFTWIGTGWGRRAIRRLVEGDCDLFPGMPLDQRFIDDNPQLIFSQAYYTLGHAVVAPESSGVRTLDDLRGKKLSVEGASLADYWAVRQNFSRHLYRRYHPEEAIKALADREADAAVMWSAVAGWQAKQHPELRLNLIRLEDPKMRVPVGMAMRKRDTDLRAAVNRALTRIGADKVGDILGRYGMSLAAADGRLSGPTREPKSDDVISVADTAPVGSSEDKGAAGETREGEMSARQIWGMCTPCHGLNARGGGIVANLKDSKLTDEQFVKTVLQGRPGTAMRPYKGLLTNKQILAVREHIKNDIP